MLTDLDKYSLKFIKKDLMNKNAISKIDFYPKTPQKRQFCINITVKKRMNIHKVKNVDTKNVVKKV